MINEEDRLISPDLAPNDQSLDRAIRPLSLQDYIGQSEVKKQMGIFIDAARNRSERLPPLWSLDFNLGLQFCCQARPDFICHKIRIEPFASL